MTRILVDVNLILDVLLDRRPHAEAASLVWAAVETGRADGFLSAHAVTTIHYLNSRAVKAAIARETTTASASRSGPAWFQPIATPTCLAPRRSVWRDRRRPRRR